MCVNISMGVHKGNKKKELKNEINTDSEGAKCVNVGKKYIYIYIHKYIHTHIYIYVC